MPEAPLTVPEPVTEVAMVGADTVTGVPTVISATAPLVVTLTEGVYVPAVE